MLERWALLYSQCHHHDQFQVTYMSRFPSWMESFSLTVWLVDTSLLKMVKLFLGKLWFIPSCHPPALAILGRLHCCLNAVGHSSRTGEAFAAKEKLLFQKRKFARLSINTPRRLWIKARWLASWSTFLCLSLLVFKMGITVLAFQDTWR